MRKLDDKGLTLIELIITVCIIAMITAPFLNSFVNASHTNARAAKRQKASTWCQYFLEECKVSTLEELKNKYLINYQDYKDASGKREKIVIDLSNDDMPSDAKIQGLEATITLSPKEYTKEGSATQDPSGNTVYNNYAGLVNDVMIPSMSDVDANKDAVLVKEFYQLDSEYNASQGAGDNIRRDCVITLKYDGIKKQYIVSAEITYHDVTGAAGSKTYSSDAVYKKSFTDDITKEDVPNIYLCYPAASVSDKITVVNELDDEDKFDVYLVIQSEFHQLQSISTQLSFLHKPNGGSALASGHSCGMKTHVWNDNKCYINGSDATSILSGRADTVDSLFNVTVSIKRDGTEIAAMQSGKEE